MSLLLEDSQLASVYEIVQATHLDATDFQWDHRGDQGKLTHLPTGYTFSIVAVQDRFRYRIVYRPGPVPVTSSVRATGAWPHVLRHLGK